MDDFPVLPPATEAPSADDTLTLQDLLGDEPSAPVEKRPVALGRTPAIDFAARTFIPSTAGGPLMLTGVETLKQWVQKCLRTRRGENKACHPDFGVEELLSDLIDGGPFDASAAAVWQSYATRALLVHPAISDVTDWSTVYIEGDDAATVTCRIELADEGEDPVDLELEVTLDG